MKMLGYKTETRPEHFYDGLDLLQCSQEAPWKLERTTGDLELTVVMLLVGVMYCYHVTSHEWVCLANRLCVLRPCDNATTTMSMLMYSTYVHYA